MSSKNKILYHLIPDILDYIAIFDTVRESNLGTFNKLPDQHEELNKIDQDDSFWEWLAKAIPGWNQSDDKNLLMRCVFSTGVDKDNLALKESACKYRAMLSGLIKDNKNSNNPEFKTLIRNKSSIQWLLKALNKSLNTVTQAIDFKQRLLNRLPQLMTNNNSIKLFTTWIEMFDATEVFSLTDFESYVPKDKSEKFVYETEILKMRFFCELAFQIENNGEAFLHATQMIIVYKTARAAIKAIKQFAELVNHTNDRGIVVMNYDLHFVHDACLFELPSEKTQYWEKWQRIFSENFSSNNIRKLLPLSGAIELHFDSLDIARYLNVDVNPDKILKKEDSIFSLHNRNVLLKAIITKKAELKKIRREYKISVQNQASDTELDVLNNLESYKRSELISLQVNYVEHLKATGAKFDKLDKESLLGLSELYYRSFPKEQEIFVRFGMQLESVQKIQDLDTSQAGKYIPAFNAKSVSQPNFYIRKLEMNDPQDLALAACLGHYTACCQSIDGFGEKCTLHGMTSPYGGFYVVFKENTHAKFDNEVVAQSWVWRGTKGELCFDSIEWNPKKITKTQLIQIYYELIQSIGRTNSKAFSGDLVKEIYQDVDYAVINTILVGSNGQTPKNFGSSAFHDLDAEKVDYEGYSDSRSQKLVYHRDIPYLLIDCVHLSNHTKKEIGLESTQRFIHESQRDIPYRKNPYFLMMLNFYSSFEKSGCSDDKVDMLACFSVYENKVDPIFLKEFQSFIKLHDVLLKNISSRADLDEIFYLVKEGAYMGLRNLFGSNLLGCMKNRPESIIAILSSMEKEDRHILFHLKDKNGDIIFQILLNDYCETDRHLFQYIQLHDDSHWRLYFSRMQSRHRVQIYKLLMRSTPTFTLIFEMVDNEERLQDLHQTEFKYDYEIITRISLFRESFRFVDILKYLLSLYPFSDQKSLIINEMQGIDPDECLLYSVEVWELLMSYMDLSLRFDYLTLMHHKSLVIAGDLNECSRLMFVAQGENETFITDEHLKLEVLLNSLPKHQIEKAILTTNGSNENAIHFSLKEPKRLKILMEALPAHKRTEALFRNNDLMHSPWMDARFQISSFIIIYPYIFKMGIQYFLTKFIQMRYINAISAIRQKPISDRFHEIICYVLNNKVTDCFAIFELMDACFKDLDAADVPWMRAMITSQLQHFDKAVTELHQLADLAFESFYVPQKYALTIVHPKPLLLSGCKHSQNISHQAKLPDAKVGIDYRRGLGP